MTTIGFSLVSESSRHGIPHFWTALPMIIRKAVRLIMKKLQKVDRIASQKEAKMLQDIGVDIIGVSLNHHPMYKDDRVISIETVEEIQSVLTTSQIAVEISYNHPNVDSLLQRIDPDYIQISGSQFLATEERKRLQKQGIKIIYTDIQADHDDDPSWILSEYLDNENLNEAYFQINLIGDMHNSWEFFKTESEKYPDELQIQDIDDLGRLHPILLSIDFTPENIFEVVSTFSSVNGIYLTLSENCTRNDLHVFSFQSVIKILTYLKNL